MIPYNDIPKWRYWLVVWAAILAAIVALCSCHTSRQMEAKNQLSLDKLSSLTLVDTLYQIFPSDNNVRCYKFSFDSSISKGDQHEPTGKLVPVAVRHASLTENVKANSVNQSTIAESQDNNMTKASTVITAGLDIVRIVILVIFLIVVVLVMVMFGIKRIL